MTPDKARDLLASTTPAEDWWHSVKGGWVRHLEPVGIDAAGELDVSEDDAALIVAAPVLAAMIAGMSPEYRAEEWRGLVIGWVPTSPWMAEKPVGGTDSHTRVVRRYVTEPEEA